MSAHQPQYTHHQSYRIRGGDAYELVAWMDGEFTPVVSALPNYVAYYGVAEDAETFVTVSKFTDRRAAAEANRRGREWLARRFPDMVITPLRFFWSS